MRVVAVSRSMIEQELKIFYLEQRRETCAVQAVVCPEPAFEFHSIAHHAVSDETSKPDVFVDVLWSECIRSLGEQIYEATMVFRVVVDTMNQAAALRD